MRALYWFRDDLRLEDNPALTAMCAKADEAIFAFVIPESNRWSRSPERMGKHRSRFMTDSLIALDKALRDRGNQLLVLHGDSDVAIVEAAEKWSCRAVYSQRCHTHEEEIAATQVAAVIPHHTFEGATLLHPDDLPFDLKDLPNIFTRFRKKVEKGGLVVRDVQSIPQIPPPPSDLPDESIELDKSELMDGLPKTTMYFDGGAEAGMKRLQHYFWGTRALSEYKKTRNGMIGWDYSSKFSPWLAWGCLSPRIVYHAILDYESDFESNESTYWLIFELLWRDYFRLIAMQHGDRIWHKTGLKDAPRKPVIHHPLQWKDWCTGNTKSDFVNANMHELRLTGFMSNRGRQNVASYAIHNMGLDWRICAAWFEHWLIDYDPCSNTGNWLYVAGIGNDPRLQREFDVEWQADRYDPEGTFRRHWNRLGEKFPCDPLAIE